MALILYDLAGAKAGRRFSPYCWRIRLALAHKELPVETVPWRFTDKQAIAFSGQGRVPVLVDAEKTLSGSWTIANYLEQQHPDRTSLFDGRPGAALTRFIESRTDRVLLPGLMPLILVDVFAHLHGKDRAYFRSSREQRLGMTLEAACADRDQKVMDFRQTLEPLRNPRNAIILAGEAPNFADYIVFSGFMWARSMSPFKLLEEDDPVALWHARLLDRFEVARMAPEYEI
jgi:glutathione S-transferase